MLSLWKRKTPDDSAPIAVSSPTSVPKSVLFPGLKEADLIPLYNHLTTEKFAPNQVILQKGQAADRILFVSEGTLQTDQGQTLKAGDWWTEADLKAGHTRLQTPLTSVEAVTLLSLPVKAYAQLPESLQHYLLDRIQQQNFQQLEALHATTGDLLRERNRLLEMLFQARTQHRQAFARTELAQQVIRKFPRLPLSTSTLLSKLLDERTTRTEIVELVRNDPALTSTLLKTINSASYSLQQKISDVNHAISLMGFESVYQVIMADSMRQTMPDTDFFRDTCTRSIEISHLVFSLSQEVGLGKPSEMATLGLMYEIGAMVIELLKMQNPRLASVFLGLDSASVGAELLRSWNLPESLCAAIDYRFYPEFAVPEKVPEVARVAVALLYLAERFCERLHQQTPTQQPLLLDDYLAVLGLQGVSEEELLYKRVLPRLRARKLALPKSLLVLLGESA